MDDDFEEDEGIYDELNLEDAEAFGLKESDSEDSDGGWLPYFLSFRLLNRLVVVTFSLLDTESEPPQKQKDVCNDLNALH
jgi:CCR4-NOT transcription complex subunit 3